MKKEFEEIEKIKEQTIQELVQEAGYKDWPEYLKYKGIIDELEIYGAIRKSAEIAIKKCRADIISKIKGRIKELEKAKKNIESGPQLHKMSVSLHALTKINTLKALLKEVEK